MSDIEIIKKYGSIENYIYELESENKQLKEDYNKAVHNSTEFESEVYELKEQLKQRDEVIDEIQEKLMMCIKANGNEHIVGTSCYVYEMPQE